METKNKTRFEVLNGISLIIRHRAGISAHSTNLEAARERLEARKNALLAEIDRIEDAQKYLANYRD